MVILLKNIILKFVEKRVYVKNKAVKNFLYYIRD